MTGALRIATLFAAIVAFSLAATGCSPANVQQGMAFVTENCSRCHAVGDTGDSPLPTAPAFRTLHERYPVEFLAEALAEGIVAGHPDMPQFMLTPRQIEDVLAYLHTLDASAD